MWTAAVAFLVAVAGSGRPAAADSDGIWTNPGRVYPAALPIADASSENPRCRQDSRLLLDGLRDETLWASKMWDSSAKSPVGVLFGANYQLGNFDECMTVTTPVRAQFCVAKVHANVPEGRFDPSRPFDLSPDPEMSVWEWIRSSRIDPSKTSRDVVYWGLCVPASCTNGDVEKFVNGYLERANHTRNTIQIDEEFCTTSGEEDQVTFSEIAFWTFTAFLVVLIVSSTVADRPLRHNGHSSRMSDIWLSFSLRRNLSFLTGTSEKPGALDFAYGIKALCSMLVVHCHRLYLSAFVSPVNTVHFEESLRYGLLSLSNIGEVGVDIFFFAGSFLASYPILKNKDINFLTLLRKIMNRILRLAPIYYYLLWYMSSAASRFGSGPLWKAEFKKYNGFCAENWWTNVLFLSNYVNTTRTCSVNWWYIPAELHLFILVTFVSYFLARNRKFGIILLVVSNVISFLIPVLIGYRTRRHPVTLFFPDILRELRSDFHFDTFYVKSHNRGTVSLIAVAAAYFYARHDSQKRYSKGTTYFMLLCSMVSIFVPTYAGFAYYDPGTPYTALEAALYLPLRRLTSAIGFSLLTIAFTLGTLIEKSSKGETNTYAGTLKQIMSSKIIIVYSRLTFIIYLGHFAQVVGDIAQQRTPIHYSTPELIIRGFLDNVRAAVLSVFLFLMIEAPFKTILQGRPVKVEVDRKKSE